MSPTLALAHALITAGQATGPGGSAAWPVFVGNEPDLPNEALTIYVTGGEHDGRSMRTGKTFEHPGYQIRVRANTFEAGAAKVDAIQTALDAIRNFRVVVATVHVYTINVVTRRPMIHLGPEFKGKRQLFTINGTLTGAGA